MSRFPLHPPDPSRRYPVAVECLKVVIPGEGHHFEPFRVRWLDDRRWTVERIYGHEVIAREDGLDITRWRVQLSGQPKYLYQKGGDSWFVLPKCMPERLP